MQEESKCQKEKKIQVCYPLKSISEISFNVAVAVDLTPSFPRSIAESVQMSGLNLLGN